MGRRRYPLNVAGDFYVEDGCCTLCGVPAVTAPELFGGFTDDGRVAADVSQCWVARQPAAPREVDAMLETMAVQELDCVRYAGTDPQLLARVRELRSPAPLCDADEVEP